MNFKSRIVQLFVESTLREEDDPLDLVNGPDSFAIDPDTAPTAVIDTVPEQPKPAQKTIDYFGQKIPLEDANNEEAVIKSLNKFMTNVAGAVKKELGNVFGQINTKSGDQDMRKFIRNPLLIVNPTSRTAEKTKPVFRPHVNFELAKQYKDKFEIYLKELITRVYIDDQEDEDGFKETTGASTYYMNKAKAAVKKENINAIENGIDPVADSIPARHLNLYDSNFTNEFLTNIWGSAYKSLQKRSDWSSIQKLFDIGYKETHDKHFASQKKKKEKAAANTQKQKKMSAMLRESESVSVDQTPNTTKQQ